jgi:hypothetical protein
MRRPRACKVRLGALVIVPTAKREMSSRFGVSGRVVLEYTRYLHREEGLGKVRGRNRARMP